MNAEKSDTTMLPGGCFHEGCDPSIQIYRVIRPDITQSELLDFRSRAQEELKCRRLTMLAESGESSALESLQHILFFGTASVMYRTLWRTNDRPMPEVARMNDAVNALLRMPLDEACAERILIDGLVLYVCCVNAIRLKTHAGQRLSDVAEISDIANEEFISYLLYRQEIAASDSPKYRLIRTLRNRQADIMNNEGNLLPVFSKTRNERHAAAAGILKFAMDPDADERSSDFQKEFMTGSYRVNYTRYRMYSIFRSRQVSIDSIDTDMTGESSSDLQPAAADPYRSYEDDQYCHDVLSSLPGRFMQEAVYETYFSPDVGSRLPRSRQQEHGFSVLHSRYGIPRELYDMDMQYAERFLRGSCERPDP